MHAQMHTYALLLHIAHTSTLSIHRLDESQQKNVIISLSNSVICFALQIKNTEKAQAFAIKVAFHLKVTIEDWEMGSFEQVKVT